VPYDCRSVVCIPFMRSFFKAMVFKTMKIEANTAGGTRDMKRNGLVITRSPTPTCTICRVFSPEIFSFFRNTSLKATKPRIINKKIKKVIHSELKGWYIGNFPSFFTGFILLHLIIFSKMFYLNNVIPQFQSQTCLPIKTDICTANPPAGGLLRKYKETFKKRFPMRSFPMGTSSRRGTNWGTNRRYLYPKGISSRRDKLRNLELSLL